MKRLLTTGVFILLVTVIPAQTQGPGIKFNGYIQAQATTNFQDNTNFFIRRLKMWVKSTPSFSPHWSYKVQVTFTSYTNEKFFLQDVKANYHTKNFSIDFGQFVPQFSLERFQPDYTLPVTERAHVINMLIPDGTLGVRDVGTQLNYHKGPVSIHLGVFNGYGIKEFHFTNKGVLLTHKTAFDFKVKNDEIKFGYSLMYRYANGLGLPKILPDTVSFTGNDVRYNLFAQYKSTHLWLQTELIDAYLNGQRMYGYYIMGSYRLKKHQLVASYEYYNDLITSTVDKPWLHLGYNYLVKGDRLKISYDNYMMLGGLRPAHYLASIRLQIFLQ